MVKRSIGRFTTHLGVAAVIVTTSALGLAQDATVARVETDDQIVIKPKGELREPIAGQVELNATPTADEEVAVKLEKPISQNISERASTPKDNWPGVPPQEDNAAPLPGLTVANPRQSNTSDNEWKFALTPYFYMTGISGTVGARERSTDIDASFGDILSDLKFGLMGAFEARRDRLVITSDLLWIRLREERDTPFDLYSTAKIGINMYIIQPQAGYRVIDREGGSLAILGGVRVMSVENTLEFTSGTLPGFDVDQRKTWAAPVAALQGELNLSPKFYLSVMADAGGGFGTDFTGQFYGGAGYRIKPNIALIGGYRYLTTDYSDDSGFVFDAAMNGIVLGARFDF